MTIWDSLNASFRELDELVSAVDELYRDLYVQRVEEQMKT